MGALSILESIARLAEIAIAVEVEQHHALEKAAQAVEKRAKSLIGHDQDGWAHLADSTEEHKAQEGFPSEAPLEATGELRESIGHHVENSREAWVGSSSMKSVWQELGTSHIPPRPFLSKAAHEMGHDVAGIVTQGWKAGFGGKKE